MLRANVRYPSSRLSAFPRPASRERFAAGEKKCAEIDHVRMMGTKRKHGSGTENVETKEQTVQPLSPWKMGKGH